jgi:hypothetical protein
MFNDPTAGLGFLGDIDGLFIQQKLELFEAITGCDTKNRYHITPIPAGSIPDGHVPPEWINHFKAGLALPGVSDWLHVRPELDLWVALTPGGCQIGCMEHIGCDQFLLIAK